MNIWKLQNENKSERVAYRRQNDTTTVGRFGSCIIKDYHFYWERQYNPSLMLAYRMAMVFGVSVEELCCLKENKELEDKEYEDL
mgnify:CR=1 FL=1